MNVKDENTTRDIENKDISLMDEKTDNFDEPIIVHEEENINRNKPWRLIIRRKIANG